jgi:hypothetical protein
MGKKCFKKKSSPSHHEKVRRLVWEDVKKKSIDMFFSIFLLVMP